MEVTHKLKSNDLPTPGVEDVFHAALEATPAERESLMVRECRGDDGMLQMVRSMVSAHLAADGFLAGMALLNAPASNGEDKEGGWIGSYQLVELIGAGSFGQVWKVIHKDLARPVALKILKLGLDTKEIVGRFEREREILARIEHPNITRIFDAGTTESGRAFFVMELVEGKQTITSFCDAANLSTTERIKLFIEVCRAVQHAHQKSIVHRDIKPSNILVSMVGGARILKLIDFGVAKALHQPVNELAMITRGNNSWGTPWYMSPEQFGMDSLDVDTCSDVYSLGVLLHELLTGCRPFSDKYPQNVAPDLLRRAVCEEEPTKPSLVLTTMPAETLARVARCRSITGPSLAKQVRGDLEWIILKALEKHPARRYATAAAMADDLQRYLDHEPVKAREPSRSYRFLRLARRHRVAFVATATVMASLITGLSVSLYLMGQARREATTRTEVVAFLTDLLHGVGPAVANGKDPRIVVDLLDRSADRLNRHELGGDSDVEQEVRTTLGRAYFDLGKYEKAAAMHQEAAMLAARTHGAGSLAEASSLELLANSLRQQDDRLADAEKVERKLLDICQSRLGPNHPRTSSALNDLGLVLQKQGRWSEAETAHRRTLAARRALAPDGESLPVAYSLANLAGTLIAQGRLREAEPLNRQAVEICRKNAGAAPLALAASLDNLANTLQAERKLDDATGRRREALAVYRQMLPFSHPELARSQYNLATVLQESGRLDDAEPLYQQAMPAFGKLPGGALADLLHHLGMLMQAQGRLMQAEEMLRKERELRESEMGNDPGDLLEAQGELMDVLRAAGKALTAEFLLKQWFMAHPFASDERSQRHRLGTARQLSRLYAEMNQTAEAAEWTQKAVQCAKLLEPAAEADCVPLKAAVAQARQTSGTLSLECATALERLTRCLMAHGLHENAEPLIREALDIRQKLQPDSYEAQADASDLGSCLAGQEREAEAAPLLLRACQKMVDRSAAVPLEYQPLVEVSLRRLCDFYDRTGRSKEALTWKLALAACYETTQPAR